MRSSRNSPNSIKNLQKIKLDYDVILKKMKCLGEFGVTVFDLHFSTEEIEVALKYLGKLKSTTPEGLNMEFVEKMLQQFYETRPQTERLNYANITWKPKTENVTRPAATVRLQWRTS